MVYGGMSHEIHKNKMVVSLAYAGKYHSIFDLYYRYEFKQEWMVSICYRILCCAHHIDNSAHGIN